MQKQKIVTVIMGQNCERFIRMCLDSVKESDAVVYCSGGRFDPEGGYDDNAVQILLDKGFRFDSIGDGFIRKPKERGGNWKPTGKDIILNSYNQEDLGMNGKQRNFYLDYVKDNYPDYWCLALDADEVVQDFSQIKHFINQTPQGVYSVKMRHLIGDLSHEDATVPEHYVLNRLFKISCAEKYPEVEHPVLQGKPNSQVGATKCTTVWHLAYIPNLWEIKKRYDNHLEKSNMHTPQYLKNWYFSHIFGKFPKKEFNPVELSPIILREFGIEPDELYFLNRKLEHKHWIDAVHWRDFFKCKTAFEFGAGLGPRVFSMNQIGIDAKGLEISEFAVENAMIKKIHKGDITEKTTVGKYDLVLAYDVLEHLPYKSLHTAIENLSAASKRFILVSVPVIGDPNLENDPTHIIKETKEWWIKQFTDKGHKNIKTPDHFLYKDQIIIFEVKNEP